MNVNPKKTKTKTIKNFLNFFSINNIKKTDKKKKVNGTLFPASIMLTTIKENKKKVNNAVEFCLLNFPKIGIKNKANKANL